MSEVKLLGASAEPAKARAYNYHIPEIAIRTVGECAISKEIRRMSTVAEVIQFFDAAIRAADWFDSEKECFVVLLLDRKNALKSWNLVSLGTVSGTYAHPRECFRAACVASASAIVCIHNHPSGDPAPSAADVQITRQLREASKILDIPLLDHVIIGSAQRDPLGRGFYSFRSAGVL